MSNSIGGITPTIGGGFTINNLSLSESPILVSGGEESRRPFMIKSGAINHHLLYKSVEAFKDY